MPMQTCDFIIHLQGTTLSRCITDIEDKEMLTGISVKGGNPLWYPTKGVTPISTMFRAATGTVTLDVVVVWVGPTILLRILQKSHTVTA